MKLLVMEPDYTAIIIIVMVIMFGIPVLLGIIGFSCRKNYPKTAKVLFIIAGVYLLISLGVCGSMML